MNIKKIIRQIVDNGNVDDMYKLTSIFEDLIDKLEDEGIEVYKDYEMQLYKMAYGSQLSREMAEEIVEKMRPYRMKWSLEETKQIQNEYGIDDIQPIDFFVVLNSKFNDDKDTVEKFAKNSEEELDMYVSLAKDFIMDEDAKQDKIFLYFTTIPY